MRQLPPQRQELRLLAEANVGRKTLQGAPGGEAEPHRKPVEVAIGSRRWRQRRCARCGKSSQGLVLPGPGEHASAAAAPPLQQTGGAGSPQAAVLEPLRELELPLEDVGPHAEHPGPPPQGTRQPHPQAAAAGRKTGSTCSRLPVAGRVLHRHTCQERTVSIHQRTIRKRKGVKRHSDQERAVFLHLGTISFSKRKGVRQHPDKKRTVSFLKGTISFRKRKGVKQHPEPKYQARLLVR